MCLVGREEYDAVVLEGLPFGATFIVFVLVVGVLFVQV